MQAINIGKMKNALVAVLLGLLFIPGNTSCMFRMLQPTPTPAVFKEDQLPAKIAILPFANKTANPEAGSLVRKMFYNFFSSLNYQDLEPYVIDDNLKTNDLYSEITAGENISPQKLGQLLGVDAVIYGEVLSLGKMYALVYSDNQAGLKARMVRCDSGQIQWELIHTIHLEEGELPVSPIGLATGCLQNRFQSSSGHAHESCCRVVHANGCNNPESACCQQGAA